MSAERQLETKCAGIEQERRKVNLPNCFARMDCTIVRSITEQVYMHLHRNVFGCGYLVRTRPAGQGNACQDKQFIARYLTVIRRDET